MAVARAPKEEMEGEARTDRELAVELRMLKKKVRKLEDQALPIPICRYGNRTGCNVENVWKGMNYGGICNI